MASMLKKSSNKSRYPFLLLHVINVSWLWWLQNALSFLEISAEQQDSIFRILSAVLHLGNLTFQAKTSESSAVTDVYSNTLYTQYMHTHTHVLELQHIAYLLQLETLALQVTRIASRHSHVTASADRTSDGSSWESLSDTPQTRSSTRGTRCTGEGTLQLLVPMVSVHNQQLTLSECVESLHRHLGHLWLRAAQVQRLRAVPH